MEFTRDLLYRFPLIRGEDVRAVQQGLITLKVQPPCGSADGIFGAATQLAVESFQQAFNIANPQGQPLPQDGVVDTQTWTALFSRVAAAGVATASIGAARAALSIEAGGSPPPLSREQVGKAKKWLMGNFKAPITAVAASSPLDIDLICAIVCKETASQWLHWTDKPAAEVLARCVFDASGDAPGTGRKAFPPNTAAFRARFGNALTEMLIAEANKTRQWRNLQPEEWVYKGYGIFQYDLQNILTDEAFFTGRLWGTMDNCLDRFMRLMNEKLKSSGGDVRDAVRRYNGSGAKAEEYARHVMIMAEWAKQQPA
jgi:hypothetical protein